MDPDQVIPGSYARGTRPAPAPGSYFLHGLTVHRPWDWAISEGHKPVENRRWPAPKWILGRHIALHAGKVYDEEAALWIQKTFGLSVPFPEQLVAGAIVAVVKVVGCYRAGQQHLLGAKPASPWAFGPWCWELGEVTKLATPIHCRGAQKLWRVPELEAARVREAWRAARRAA